MVVKLTLGIDLMKRRSVVGMEHLMLGAGTVGGQMGRSSRSGHNVLHL